MLKNGILSMLKKRLYMSEPLASHTSSSEQLSLSRQPSDVRRRCKWPDMSMAAGHPTLLTPGPIEADTAVLDAMQECLSDADFTRIFAETLQMLRQLLQTSNPSSQPFVVGGSGSLGFDQVAANVLQPGDEVLVLKR